MTQVVVVAGRGGSFLDDDTRVFAAVCPPRTHGRGRGLCGVTFGMLNFYLDNARHSPKQRVLPIQLLHCVFQVLHRHAHSPFLRGHPNFHTLDEQSWTTRQAMIRRPFMLKLTILTVV